MLRRNWKYIFRGQFGVEEEECGREATNDFGNYGCAQDNRVYKRFQESQAAPVPLKVVLLSL